MSLKDKALKAYEQTDLHKVQERQKAIVRGKIADVIGPEYLDIELKKGNYGSQPEYSFKIDSYLFSARIDVTYAHTYGEVLPHAVETRVNLLVHVAGGARGFNTLAELGQILAG